MVVAAQIIPVMILALLADPLTKDDRPTGRTVNSVHILVALVAGLIGETAALREMVSGTTSGASVLIATCMFVIAYVILRPHIWQHFGAVFMSIPRKVRYALEPLAMGVFASYAALGGLGVKSAGFRIMAWTFVVVSILETGWQTWRIYRGQTPYRELIVEAVTGRRKRAGMPNYRQEEDSADES